MAYSIAFHIVGIVLWLGGLMILTRVMKIASGSTPTITAEGALFPTIVRKIWFGFVIPGLLIATLTGLYQLLSTGISIYMKQGWFHAKLTLLVVLFVVTWLVHLEVRKVLSNAQPNSGRLTFLHAASGALLLLVVVVTIVYR